MYYTNIVKKLLLASILLGISATAYGSVYLSGQITARGSAYTNTNGYVSLSCNNGYYWASDWDYVDSNGNYSMDSDNYSYSPCGSYYSGTSFTSCDLYAYPAWNDSDTRLGVNKTSVTISCGTNTTKNIALGDKDRTIAVTVTAGGTAVTSGITVYASQQESPYLYSYVSTAENGVYNLPVTAGNFTVSAYCNNMSCNYSGYPTASVSVTSSDTTKTASLSFSVKDKTINITVKAGTQTVTSDVTVSCSQQESPWTWSSSSTASNGVYSMLVTAGNYRCNAYCTYWNSCSYSGYPSTDTFSVASSASSVDQTLRFTVRDKTLRVTIMGGGSRITSGMTAYASEQGGGWGYVSRDYSNGETYNLEVGAAKYYVSAYCTNWSSCDVAGYPAIYVDIEDSDTTVDATLTFLRNDATISGVVTDSSGGVSTASISIYSYKVSGEGASTAASLSKGLGKATITQSSTTTMVSAWTQTDSSGAFQVKVPAGTYTVQVWPPWQRTDLGSSSIETTASSNATTSLSIALSTKSAVISGKVTDADGNGIQNVSISGWSYGTQMGTSDWFWTQTDSTGAYSVKAIEGLKYNVSAYFWSSSRSNTICNYTNEGMQTVVGSSTAQTLNFTYPTCDCVITLNTVDSSGNLISSIYGGVNAAPESLASGEYWYGIWGSISGGTGTMSVQSDVEYKVSPYIWDSSYVQGDDFTATCTSGAITKNIELLALDATISGSFVDESGNTITTDQYSHMYVSATKGRAYRSCTSSSDGFTCSVSAGSWCLGYWVDASSGYASSSAGSSTSCVTMTSGGAETKNITLLKTGTINVTVNDSAGNPKQNVWVEATPYSNEHQGENEYEMMYHGNGCNTMPDGTCSINVGAASTGTTYYLNAYIPYYLRSTDNLLTPQETSVLLTSGGTESAVLSFEKPDGTVQVQVAEGSASASISLGKGIAKEVVNLSESASSPIANATVDCFSPSGASFQVEANENGVATCPCSTVDTWKAAAYNIVANNLWMSDVTDITCAADGGSGTVTVNNVATVPEGKSVTVSDVTAQSLTVELSDGFSVFFPQSSLGTSGQATCNVDIEVTPFTANRRPASFYGYTVSCQDGNGASIIQLNSNATFSVPVNQGQVENVGLTMDSIEMCYFSDSNGAYAQIEGGYTIDDTNDVITYQQNHLTDFAIVGNGNLAGTSGDNAGSGANEFGDSGGTETAAAAEASGASSGCGCRINNESSNVNMALAILSIIGLFAGTRIMKFALRKNR